MGVNSHYFFSSINNWVADDSFEEGMRRIKELEGASGRVQVYRVPGSADMDYALSIAERKPLVDGTEHLFTRMYHE